MKTVIEAALDVHKSPEAIYRAIRLLQLDACKVDGKWKITEKALEKWLKVNIDLKTSGQK